MPTTVSGNTLSKRMDYQEHAFSDLINRLGDLSAGYNMLLDLRELKAQPVPGLAMMELTLGPWSEQCNLMAVPLDDFDLILAKEIMATNKIFSVPHLNSVMVADEKCPTFILTFTIATNAVAAHRLLIGANRVAKFWPCNWKTG
ncbi:hypothetical protein ACH5RR_021167 [Cinchona calisaya]|uniref:Uncharacterized protein n=1 Tax=Cinchona calisaya TaxID=153742 RepID=A0ABD2ZGQ5_9GENT